MKKHTLQLMLSLFMALYAGSANAQCFVDAGPDKIVCRYFSSADTVQLDGNATGGVANLSYTWSTSFTKYSTTFSAADFLDDIHVPNPHFVDQYNAMPDSLTFTLTISDSAGNSCSDSMKVFYSHFYALPAYQVHTIHQGDSIELNSINIGSNYPITNISWQPAHSISGSTTGVWAKPDTTTFYSATVTNALGCTTISHDMYRINVLPTAANGVLTKVASVKIYPNPVINKVTIEVKQQKQEGLNYVIYDLTGRSILHSRSFNSSHTFSTENLSSGIYFYRVSGSSGLLGQGKFVKE